ncbi:MAG: iron-sulfur cluster assembly scaffold protein [Candidatus Nanohaloarchaea archaeon]|nr:iron-sulfur cluster assembly scaffold protein [Candidatus Nanohaloarchaea archaeon]
MKNMYRQRIIELYRNPKNSGKLEKGIKQKGENPHCGDITELYIDTREGKIKDIRHTTNGCAISTAAVSLLSKQIKGMEIEKAMELDRDWMLNLLEVEISPMRMKCALLGLKTLKKALKDT